MSFLAFFPHAFCVGLFRSWLRLPEIGRLEMAMCSSVDEPFLAEVYKRLVLCYGTKESAHTVATLFGWMNSRGIKLSVLSLSIPLPEEVRKPLISLVVSSSTELVLVQIKDNNLILYALVNALTTACPRLKMAVFQRCRLDSSISALLMMSKMLVSLRFIACTGFKVHYFSNLTCPSIKELVILSAVSEVEQTALVKMCPNLKIMHKARST